MDSNTEPARDVSQSVDQIVTLEERASARRTRGQAAVETFVSYVGTLPFVLVHLFGLAAWMAVNLRWVPHLPAFDPYPFNLLATLLSFEGVVLAALVLMTQQRMSTMSDRRDHLGLQVNLLTERETTQILRLVREVSLRMGIDHSEMEEAAHLAEPTSVNDLVGALHSRITDRPRT